MILLVSLFLASVLFIFTPQVVVANETNNFVSVINPVRINNYNPNPGLSLKAEYEVVESLNLPATWLLTYDALKNEDVREVVKGFDGDQEFGIFFEVSEKFCEAAGVTYDKSFSWHHAANVFLTGYSQKDRLKLIDTVFDEFKSNFGYYPKSVGAWWIDAFSLSYMHDRYGVIANLGLADQYSTDGYRVWGTYWAEAFYPSRIHSGIPGEENNRSGVVTVQWAPRDPLNGYFDSYYSTQDYLQVKEGLTTSYFESLVDIYSDKHKNKFGHIVVGLESDLKSEAYSGEFKNQIASIRKKVDLGNLNVINLSDFATWYKETFPDRSPSYLVESSDLLGKNLKTFWYSTNKYRVGVNYNTETSEVEVFDFHVFPDNFYEPYYLSPNKDFKLLIQNPSLIDKVAYNHSWSINLGKLVQENYSDNSFGLDFEKGKMFFSDSEIIISGVDNIPESIKQSRLINVENSGPNTIIYINQKYETKSMGHEFWHLRPEARNFIASKKGVFLILFFILLVTALTSFFLRKKYKRNLFLLWFLVTATVFLSAKQGLTKYYVSQTEIDALRRLQLMDGGNIMVYDNTCLGCSWNTPQKPATYENLKGYITKFSGKKIVYNKSVFEAKDQQIAGDEFEKIGAKYIYVTNYEGNVEKVPFSPGDLGIELVYENANAQIWKKVK